MSSMKMFSKQKFTKQTFSEKKSSLQDWLAWQETLHPSEIDLGLERVKSVLIKLLSIDAEMTQSVQLPVTVISVAGTNGKGSTVTQLESIYTEAGYKVGSYTSPHLQLYNERFEINRELLSDEDLCQSFARINKARQSISITYFEFATLAAIDIFVREQCDIIILEVGLGGRLDAVNIVEPDVSIITTIDLDHQDWLGSDRDSIGLEKAGIYRHNKPAIYGDTDMPESIKQFVAEKGIKLYQYGESYRVKTRQHPGQAIQWDWLPEASGRQHSDQRLPAFYNLPLPEMKGEVQLVNAANALMTTILLRKKHPVTQAEIKRGLLNARISGRFQIVAEHPLTILDVAHNVQAVSHLKTMLTQFSVPGKLHAIIGMLNDKDIRQVLEIMHKIVHTWRIIELDTIRALKAEQIKQLLIEISEHEPDSIRCFNNFSQAYEDLTYSYKPEVLANDKLIIFGSFYTVADALQSKAFKGMTDNT
jgi:dihydrofolate synthase/folylpolyglutamate synthase